jgi:hypothetical protein
MQAYISSAWVHAYWSVINGTQKAEAYTASDGITNHQPVLVTRNQAEKLRQQITKLGNSAKAGRDNKVPVLRLWSDQLVPYR